MKLSWLIAAVASGVMSLMANAAAAPGQWEQPAAQLAEQIAGVLGPGQAHLTIRNLSTISTDEIPTIRRLLEQDLKARGVTTSDAETANLLRVTLSENVRERLWVAEIVEGNETRVAMVHVDQVAAPSRQSATGLMLRKLAILTTSAPVLAALETQDSLIVIEPEEIVIYSHTAQSWQERKRVATGQKKQLARDPRSVIRLSPGTNELEASVSRSVCSGAIVPARPAEGWTVRCQESDDPWPILTADTPTGPTTIKAFYNSARNYFTGVVTPGLGVDLPPFYSATFLPRPSGAAFLFNGIDGKVQLVESGAMKPVSGTRDWGSDFATLSSGCGAGTQIIASGSGEALSDSLRAYELPAQEAVPASVPLAMEGTVTELWSAPDGKSVFAVVRKTAGPGSADSYEVDRVAASCN
jgi:hypothetical protein